MSTTRRSGEPSSSPATGTSDSVAIVHSRPTTPPARRISGIERVWVAMAEVAPPFVITGVFEGAPGGDLDEAAWKAAVAEVASVHPGARVRLEGFLGRTRWVSDAAPPTVRVVDGRGWEAAGPEGAPFLDERLDARGGRAVELVLVRGARPRVVFRALHAAFDGMAACLFLREVFAALRGEAILGPTDTMLTDGDVARGLGQTREQPPGMDHLAVTGAPREALPGPTIWRRRRVVGAPSKLLPRLGLALAREAYANAAGGPPGAPGKVRVDFPVDLRRHRGDVRSLGNLTGLLRVPIAADATVDDVQAALRRGLDAREEARSVLLAEGVRGVPLWLVRAVARGTAKKMLARGRFDTTATVSNLGRLDVAAYAGAGFATTQAFFVAPISPALPCFVCVTGDPEGVEIVTTMPVALASEGRLDRLMDALAAALSTSRA